MKNLFACLLPILALSGITGLAARADAPEPALDAYEDPLPPGAIARLGTTRLRHACRALAWAPDGKTFASIGNDGAVRIWDAASGKEVRQINMRGNWFNTPIYNSDGKYLVAGAEMAAFTFSTRRRAATCARSRRRFNQSWRWLCTLTMGRW
jgi:hypothetical protein